MKTLFFVVIPQRKQPSYLSFSGLIHCHELGEAEQLAQEVGGKVLLSQIFFN